MQSHLSATGSQQRIRPSSPNPSLSKETAPGPTRCNIEKASIPVASSASPRAPRVIARPAKEGKAQGQTSRICRKLKWLFYAYCCICVAFFTIKFPQELEFDAPRLNSERIHSTNLSIPHVSPESSYTPALSQLSLSHQFSRLSSLHSQTTSLRPFVLKAQNEGHITACLWSRHFDATALVGWIYEWRGPISYLLVTEEPSSRKERHQLTNTLSSLHNDTIIKKYLSLHLLFVKPQTKDAPNAYLNLARLLSSTSQVLLLPADVSSLPRVTARSSKPASFQHPTILTGAGSASFPFPPYTPVVLDQQQSVWCTERFVSGSRQLDWDECLWQIWLSSFGEVEHWVDPAWEEKDTYSFVQSALTLKIHNRLSGKFRTETCVLAVKRLQMANEDVEGSKMAWLKEACKESLSWASDIL